MDLTGKTIGSYRILKLLGEGGMGVVYLAEHTAIGGRAALKLLHPTYAKRPRTLRRFFDEARAVNVIRHQNIIHIYDFGEDPTFGAYMVMEYLEGETLYQRLRREKVLGARQVASLVRRVALAVQAAHDTGIIHRDLKPENIYLVPDADNPGDHRVKVLDFGIAKLAGDMRHSAQATRPGAIIGSPLYMSPEQCVGEDVDYRADIYSLGVIAYEALVGRAPFQAANFVQIAKLHVEQPAPSFESLGVVVPAGIEEVVRKANAKTPGERFESILAFADALKQVAGGTETDDEGDTLEAFGRRPGDTGSGELPLQRGRLNATSARGTLPGVPRGSAPDPVVTPPPDDDVEEDDDPLRDSKTIERPKPARAKTLQAPPDEPPPAEPEPPESPRESVDEPPALVEPQPVAATLSVSGESAPRRSWALWVLLAVLVSAGAAAGGYFAVISMVPPASEPEDTDDEEEEEDEPEEDDPEEDDPEEDEPDDEDEPEADGPEEDEGEGEVASTGEPESTDPEPAATSSAPETAVAGASDTDTGSATGRGGPEVEAAAAAPPAAPTADGEGKKPRGKKVPTPEERWAAERDYMEGRALLADGRPAEAVPLLKRAAATDPRLFNAWLVLGDAYKMMGRTGDACKAFKKFNRFAKTDVDLAAEGCGY